MEAEAWVGGGARGVMGQSPASVSSSGPFQRVGVVCQENQLDTDETSLFL